MTITQLIKQLESKLHFYGDLPVYTNGEPDLIEIEVSGVKVLSQEEEDDLNDILELQPLPERIYLKV